MLAFAQELDVSYEIIDSQYEIVSCRIRLTNNTGISIASVYLPSPPFNVTQQPLLQTFRQMGTPRMILGDFNAHGTDWGCHYNDRRSQILSNIFDVCDLSILNTGEITRIAAPPAECSAIDMSLCSSNIALQCTWRTSDCPSRSDHLPIIVEYRKRPELMTRTTPMRSLSKHIDWSAFQTALTERLTMSPNESWTYDDLMSTVKQCATDAQTIPLSPSRTSRRGVAKDWWNADLQTKYNAKKVAFGQFRRNGGQVEYLAYKNAKAAFKRARRFSKRESWRNFCSSLNSTTSLPTLYNMAATWPPALQRRVIKHTLSG